MARDGLIPAFHSWTTVTVSLPSPMTHHTTCSTQGRSGSGSMTSRLPPGLAPAGISRSARLTRSLTIRCTTFSMWGPAVKGSGNTTAPPGPTQSEESLSTPYSPSPMTQRMTCSMRVARLSLRILLVESSAGATAIGPGWMLSPRLSAGASVPLAVPGFLRALIEPGVRY